MYLTCVGDKGFFFNLIFVFGRINRLTGCDVSTNISYNIYTNIAMLACRPTSQSAATLFYYCMIWLWIFLTHTHNTNIHKWCFKQPATSIFINYIYSVYHVITVIKTKEKGLIVGGKRRICFPFRWHEMSRI